MEYQTHVDAGGIVSQSPQRDLIPGFRRAARSRAARFCGVSRSRCASPKGSAGSPGQRTPHGAPRCPVPPARSPSLPNATGPSAHRCPVPPARRPSLSGATGPSPIAAGCARRGPSATLRGRGRSRAVPAALPTSLPPACRAFASLFIALQRCFGVQLVRSIRAGDGTRCGMRPRLPGSAGD